MKEKQNFEYDVALSFAGEDRVYVEKTAEFLKDNDISVFYDKFEETKLWGKDLYQHLNDIYKNKAKYTVVFISKNYKEKLWTNHELSSAQTRAFIESKEYILPAKFDETELPGLNSTISYISLKKLLPDEFGKKILEKLGVNKLEKNQSFDNYIWKSISMSNLKVGMTVSYSSNSDAGTAWLNEISGKIVKIESDLKFGYIITLKPNDEDLLLSIKASQYNWWLKTDRFRD